MWATDASYFRVVGWGYYYLVTVMDGYSRFILAHRLQRDMSSDSLIEVLQEAVETNGKLERYHQTLKRDVNQLPYEMPLDLEAAIVAFVSYYNYRRYHKALGNVTPSDVLREGGRRFYDVGRRCRLKQSNDEDSIIGPSGSLRDPNPIPDLSALIVSHFCWLLTFPTIIIQSPAESIPASTPTPKPQPTVDMGVPPADPVETGNAYDFKFGTLHCGVENIAFGGQYWRAENVPEEWKYNPPVGWNETDATGRIELLTEDIAVFTSVRPASGGRVGSLLLSDLIR